MKEQEWEEAPDEGKEFFDSTVIPEEEETEKPRVSGHARVTELRRRIEERLDSKRIALEFEYDDLDDLPDNLQ